MYSYINSNTILPACQCGFRKGFETSVTLDKVTDDIIPDRDCGRNCVLVL